MTYKPSPKPDFDKPTHIKYDSMETYIWGDEGNTPKSNMNDLSFFEEDQISTLCRTTGIAQILQ